MDKNSLSYEGYKRLDWIDSIKGVFILLVVFGHLTAGAGRVISLKSIEISHYLIYSYHMPMFILITGLFSKKEQKFLRIVATYIIPYIIFDLAYVLWCLVLGKEANLNILIPTYVYWYILCIAIQKLFISKIKSKTILASIIVFVQVWALFVPEKVWRILSIGRVALLFPIFCFGYSFPIEKLRNMRNRKTFSIVVGLVSLGINMLLYEARIVPVSATHNYYSSFAELAIKYVYMITTIGLFICLNSIFPVNKVLSRWGKNSLLVYLLHPYFTDVIGYLLKNVINNNTVSALICVFAAIIVTNILSMDRFRKMYDSCMKRINTVLRLER